MIISPSLIWFLVGVAFLIAELAMPAVYINFFYRGMLGCSYICLVN